ncbi:hypothetical protein [Hyphomonas sp.]|uniref:hypothetical protein n=1 Tax=Hyphomonas sp. TaxID=87 RepID=UPI0032ED9AD2
MDRTAGLIGAERIEDPELVSGNARARRIVGLYPVIYQETATVWPWACVRKRKMLTKSETVPEFGFGCQYALGGDALGVQAALTGGVEWELEGRHIVTDYDGPLPAILSWQVPEEHLHPLVASYMATRLAMACVMGVAESTTAQERLKGLVQDAFLEAALSENAQGSSLDKLSSEWVLSMQTSYAPEERITGLFATGSYWLGEN